MIKKDAALHTYANPISIPNIPRGKDEWYQFEHDMFSHENKPECVKSPDYRSISDPTVFYHEGKWYLYPSYGMAWVTEDFETWTHKRTEPYCPKYSPCITKWKDGKFLFTAWNSPLYTCDDPLGPFEKLGDFIMPDGTPFVPCDPCIFTDDDGRIYLYAFVPEREEGDRNFICKIMGYELDGENPCQVIGEPKEVIRMHPDKNPWERHGMHSQNVDFGWVEGPHVLKHNGRYYMIYAAPDTCHSNYCMAVYYSDVSPVEGFVCQKKNPLTIHTNGIVWGAGHGSVEHGPNGTLWAFYTIAAPYLHIYERRIGMDLVDVDENGELYCPFGVTDTPQYVPGFKENPVKDNNSLGYVSLTGGVRPTVSSQKEGREGVYATDESNLSFWQPEDGDEAPTIECNLSDEYYVGAVRLFWRDVGLDYKKGNIPQPVRYILEGKNLDGEWFTLVDRRDSSEELNIDYRSFEVKKCDKVRLTVTKWGKGLKLGLIEFAVFGKK